MHTTMDLFAKAIAKESAANWANRLNITRQTFSNAKKAQRLSPALAGNLAIELGEDAEHWIAVAAIEAEKQSPLLDRLKKSQALRRKLLLSNKRAKSATSGFLFQTAVSRLGYTINGTFYGTWMYLENFSKRVQCVPPRRVQPNDIRLHFTRQRTRPSTMLSPLHC